MKSYSLEIRGGEVDEPTLRRFYAQTTPPGGPPFEAIREYVAAAYLQATVPDAARLDLHLLATLDFERLPAGIVRPRELCEWTTAEAAIAALHSIRDAIERLADGFAPSDVRTQVLEQLFVACDHIASRGGACHLVAIDWDPTATERAAFAAAGIVPRPGKQVSEATWLRDLAATSDRMTEFRFLHRRKPDAYIALVTRLVQLASGHLPIENLGGAIEVQRRWATLRFTLDGRDRDYVPRYFGDAMDREVVTWIDRLLRERDEGWGFYGLRAIDLDPSLRPPSSHNWIVFACSRDDFERLTAAGTRCRPVAEL